MGLALIPILGPIIDKALSFIPDPEQKAKAKAQMEKQILDSQDSFRDFVLAYEGAGKDVHPFLQLYRGSVRPTLTYFLVAVFAYGFINPTAIGKDTMSMLFNLNLLSLGFWYGERALRGLGLDLGKAFTKK